MSRRTAAIAVVLLAVLAGAFRCTFPSRAFADDPPYHLLRVERLLNDAPAPTDVDPFVAHPGGSRTMWPWGFDWLLAGLARPFTGAHADRPSVVDACGAAIPVLGALLVPLTFLLCAGLLGRRRAVLAAGLVAIQPLHAVYSAVGRVDHHVMEPLLLVLGAALALRSPGAKRLKAGIAASGLAAGLSFAFFPTAFVQVVALLVTIGPLLALRGRRDGLLYGAGTVAGAALALLASPRPLEWVFHTPSILHIALAAFGVAAVAVAEERTRRHARPIAALTTGAAVAAALLAILVALVPAARSALGGGLGYFLRLDGGFMSDESLPLFASPLLGLRLVTWLAPLALVGLAALARGKTTPERQAAAALATVVLGCAVVQLRFLVVATPMLALAMAEGLGIASRRARELLARTRLPRLAAELAIGGACATALVPSARLVLAGVPVPALTGLMYDAADLLAEEPPPPGTGALVPAAYGHLFQLWGGVPTVCDNFWGDPQSDAAQHACLELMFETDDARIAALLDRYRIGAVVTPPPTARQVALDAERFGLDPESMVTESGLFTSTFGRTLWGRLGRHAATAPPGEPGPFGMTLLRRLIAREGERIAAVVLVLERRTQTP